ncbi:hypothetical protein HU734_012025 [Pseudomonas wayambapalatensis]|nr:hypothetical protein HU734_012025 [Pseudomonas wayambapalatensis]
MSDPNHPDPYVDEVPHDPGEKIPAPDPQQEAPEWPEGQVPQKSNPPAEGPALSR